LTDQQGHKAGKVLRAIRDTKVRLVALKVIKDRRALKVLKVRRVIKVQERKEHRGRRATKV
jgi:hypothetical protein